MGRIVAIDYGQKRVGIAITDPLNIFAQGFDTVRSDEILQVLKEYTEKEYVEEFVVGFPKDLRNRDAESMRYVKPFIKSLKKHFPHIPVLLMDERFTSKMAVQAMINGGMKKKDRQNKSTIDKISAVILLQSYLDSKKIK
ncbi:Holliday junction resolvase RuvX [Bacteroidota bacterium]